MIKHKKIVIFTVFAIIALAIYLFGFLHITRSEELKSIIKISENISPITTGTEIWKSIQDNGTTLGMPIYAKVILEYEPKEGYSEDDVFKEIIEVLEKNNWEKKALNTTQTGYYSATLSDGDFEYGASVSVQTDRDLVSISLDRSPK